MIALRRKISFLAMLCLGLSMASVTTSCGKDNKNKSIPSYPAKFIKISGETVSLLDCDTQGLSCNNEGIRTVNISEVFSRYEDSLGISQLKADLTKADSEKTQVTQDLTKFLNGKDPSVELSSITIKISDLQGNIDAADRYISANGLVEPVVSMRAQDISDLAKAKETRDRIVSSLSKISDKAGVIAHLNLELSKRQVRLSSSRIEFSALEDNALISTSKLSEKLTWLPDMIISALQKI